jgi:hypothetical protein
MTTLSDTTRAGLINLAKLAREIAIDMLPLTEVLRLNQISDEEWERISQEPRFRDMLDNMVADWNAASNTKQRVQLKAATGMESFMEHLISEGHKPEVPLSQKVELAKLLAKLGELEASREGFAGGQQFGIYINVQQTDKDVNIIAGAPMPPRALP